MCSIPWHSTLFNVSPFHSTMIHYIPYNFNIFQSLLVPSIPLHSTILYSIPLHSISRANPSFHTVPFYLPNFSLYFIPHIVSLDSLPLSSYFRSSHRTSSPFHTHTHLPRHTLSLFHVSLSMSRCGSFPFRFLHSQSVATLIRYACVLAQKSGKLLPATTSETERSDSPFPLSLSATPTLCLFLPSHTMAGLLISVAQKMAAASANFADNENRVVSLVPFPVPFFPLLVICKVVQKLSSKVTIFSCRGLCLLPAGG